MKCQAAVLRGVGKDWEISEIDVDPHRDGEVLVRMAVAGYAIPTTTSRRVHGAHPRNGRADARQRCPDAGMVPAAWWSRGSRFALKMEGSSPSRRHDQPA